MEFYVLPKMKVCSDFLIHFSILILFYGTCINSLINYTDLMKAYYLLCGAEYFCFPSYKTHQWEILPNLSYRHFNVCPECQCDNACIQRGDCCADLYFSFPHLNCVNRTIINGRYEKDQTEQYSALMVDSCPVGSSKELKEKCSSLNDTKSRLKHYPVTGNELPLTFYNIFCAKCNNVFNFTSWSLDINCSLFADFNYLTTLDEVVDLAIERRCIFQAYKKDDEFGESKEENCFDIDGSQTIITKCNQTSEWIVYDRNIAYACESFFKGNYRFFKNVFCYMCNPSGHEFMTNTIATCNVTGEWLIQDSGLQQACTDLPMSFSTAPFKNIFCYLCNRGNDSSQMFVDIMGKVNEFPIEDIYFHFQYDLYIADFNLQYFTHNSLKRTKKEKQLGDFIRTPFHISSFMINNGSYINMTNLLLQNAAIDGSISVCKSRRSVFPKGYGDGECKCDILCFYGKYSPWVSCCSDLSLQIPFHCQDILDLSHAAFPRSKKRGFLTINGCFQETTLKLIRLGCAMPEDNDIFSTIPLNEANGINYDNFYCILCNFESDKLLRKMQGIIDLSNSSINETNSGSDNHINQLIEVYKSRKDSFTIWNLEMVCPKYLDYSHCLMAGDIVYLAKQIKCRIQFKTGSTGSDYCPHRKPSGRCAYKEGWKYSDQDVKWGCENVITYKEWWAEDLPSTVPANLDLAPEKHYRNIGVFTNILCALCKPEQTFQEFFVENCTISDSSEACYNFPRTYYYYPFKNVYCLLCNDLLPISEKSPVQERELEIYNRIVGINWFPMLRNLFSISEYDTMLDETTIAQCTSRQVYDPFKGLCRNITCYSGKYFDGENCKPLMAITMNLRYSMTVKIGLYTFDESNSYLMLPESPTYVQQTLDELLSYNGGNSLQNFKGIEGFDGGPGVSKAICLTIDFDIYFKSSVSRIQVEDSLINFKRQLKGGCDHNITLSNSTIHNGMSRSSTKMKRSANIGSDLYFSAKVSTILLCPQIQLDDDEYNISHSASSLSLTREGFQNISFDDFAFTPDGKMRVCLNDLQQIHYLPIQRTAISVLTDWKQKYLWIISLVASIISIISLSIGLIIYSMFPSLRSIPGKLLMLMMLCLLLTLLFLQISFFVVQTRYGCFVVAIVLHFMWISVFTSMQTSNFHMWRTFTSKEVRLATPKRTLIWYAVYTFGIPICLVLINIFFSWIMHSNPFESYGGSKCFFRDVYLLIALFVCPVALVCLFNIVIFSFTIHSIKMTPSAENNQQRRNELAIFIRMATITGLSWLLQILDSFLPFTYFAFVSTMINSLQGFLVFIAFVVNKRIWSLLSRKYSRKQDDKRLSRNQSTDNRTIEIKRSNDVTMPSVISDISQEATKNNENPNPIEQCHDQIESTHL